MQGTAVLPMLVMLVMAFSGCQGKEEAKDCATSASTASSGSCSVDLYDNSFKPQELWVKQGTTVVFKNEGKNTHTASADDGSWTTPDVKPDASASHAFSTGGNFPIHCKYHESTGMKATVHVV